MIVSRWPRGEWRPGQRGHWWIPVVLLAVAALAVLLVPAIPTGGRSAKVVLTESNAHQLATTVMIYATDFDGRCPPDMSSSFAAIPYLGEQCRSSQVGRSMNPGCPGFLGHGGLATKQLSEVSNPSLTLEFFDSAPWPGRFRIAAVADGHALRLNETQFQTAVVNQLRLAERSGP